MFKEEIGSYIENNYFETFSIRIEFGRKIRVKNPGLTPLLRDISPWVFRKTLASNDSSVKLNYLAKV